jgi:toxin YoeB
MTYRIEYAKKAETEISGLKKSDVSAYDKLVKLIRELHEHPRTGTGRPELMKHGRFKGLWSRRITTAHRLVYSIHDCEITVSVLSAKRFYDEK